MIDIPKINSNVRLRSILPEAKYMYLALLAECDSNAVVPHDVEALAANWFHSVEECNRALGRLMFDDIVRTNGKYMMVRYYQDFAPARRKPRIAYPSQPDLIDEAKGFCPCPASRLESRPAPNVPFNAIIEAYNTILVPKGCPPHLVTTDLQRGKLRARWTEDTQRQDVGWWIDLFNHIANHCPFLIGAKGKDWTCSLEWLTRPENLAKVINGFYDR